MIAETLVRPDWSRWTAFDRASESGLSVDQGRIQRLLRLVGLGRGCRSQIAAQRVIATRDHVEAGHRCAERLHAKCRAGWRASGNAVAGIVGENNRAIVRTAAAGVRAGNERI